MISNSNSDNLLHFEFKLATALEASGSGGRIDIQLPMIDIVDSSTTQTFYTKNLGLTINSGSPIPCNIIAGLTSTTAVTCYLY